MIHHPKAPPESGKSIYMPEKIASTFAVKISPVVTECSPEVRGLDMSIRNCMFPDEHHIKYFKTYTLQGCLIECRMNWLISKCRCHPYFYDFEQANLRVYNPPPGYQKLNSENASAVLNCSDCLPPCHDNTFLVDYDMVPDTDPTTKESTGHIDVFYKEMGAIKYRRERAFTLMQLIG
ncbi:hypothetical protein B7P43_G13172 [Cryptotermes secundus]|uniref:Uncharacterized protein n=2 Tax=Cryptotermes secundus TaxID=105785 RepID=A0A2J7Q472_9NEOP|nr:hypothetical protein B7P43_G13172 [Cryptotermes secundus]